MSGRKYFNQKMNAIRWKKRVRSGQQDKEWIEVLLLRPKYLLVWKSKNEPNNNLNESNKNANKG